jgi:hypothetical protein
VLQESARRQGGVFKVAPSPARAAVAYAVVYSDDSEGEGWGFDGDKDDNGRDEFDDDFDDDDVTTAPPLGRPPPPTDKPPPRPPNRPALNANSLATRDGERKMTMADVEKIFEWCGDEDGAAAPSGGSTGRKRARSFPAPTDREVVLLLALDQQTQMALISSLYSDRTTAFHEEELGLEEVRSQPS